MRHVGAVVFCCFASNGGRREFRGEEIFVTFYEDSSDSVKSQAGPPEMSSMYGVLYAFIGAGFYEEFTFRGFLMQGSAMLFGGSRGAWIGACIMHGALFWAAHAYQNPLGIAITGTLGILMGLLVPASGRNLWAVIIGHGLFDASRFVVLF